MYKKILILCFVILFSTILKATEQGLMGVWKGNIGNQGIIACFNYADELSGNYYYLLHLQPIDLVKSKKVGIWSEYSSESNQKKQTTFGN